MRGWSLGKVSDQTQGTIHLSASREFGTATILPGKMTADHIVCHGQKLAMHTCRTFHSWLLAETSHPFIATSRGVTRFSGCSTFKPSGIYVVATTEQRPKQGDFCVRRRAMMYVAAGRTHDETPQVRMVVAFVSGFRRDEK